MAFKVFDRVKQISTTTGNSFITFASTPTGYKSFATVLDDGDTTFYCIVGSSGASLAAGEWEVGVGTWDEVNGRLTRTSILSNYLNNTDPVVFTAGNKDVFMDYPATRAIYNQAGVDAVINTLTVGKGLNNISNNLALGNTVFSATTSGNNNVAIGYNNMRNHTSAIRNIVIGYGAGQGITTSGANVFIGNETGWGDNGPIASTEGQNVGIGAFAMKRLNTGYWNVGIGSNTLYGNTALGLTGFNNNVIGRESASSISSGSGNNILGSGSGQAITTGYQNQILGGSSGGQITTGNDNIAIGHSAFGGNRSNCVALGGAALAADNGSVQGGENMAIGGNALRLTTTGYRNVGIGSVAGYALTTGVQNVAIGFYSMQAAGGGAGRVTGDDNTGVGAYSLQNLTTGLRNTSIGMQSGVNCSTGSYNVAIGYYAGQFVTTGDANIHIGKEAYASGATATNEIVLGGSVTGLGSNTTLIGNASTTQAKIHGKVAVGGSTPASATAAGVTGTITWDANYIYVCTATNTWKRVAIATW